MERKSIRQLQFILALAAISCSISFFSQETFDYEAPFEEVYSNPLNIPHVGLGVFIFSDSEGEYVEQTFEHLPLGMEIYYEYSRLIFRNSDDFNISVNVGAQAVIPYILGLRIPFGADIRLGNLARKTYESGSRGLLFGGGYEYTAFLNPWVDDFLSDSTGKYFGRVGFAVENVIFIYQNNPDSKFLRHNFTVGMKLD